MGWRWVRGCVSEWVGGWIIGWVRGCEGCMRLKSISSFHANQACPRGRVMDGLMDGLMSGLDMISRGIIKLA